MDGRLGRPSNGSDHEIVNFAQGLILAFILKLDYMTCQLGLLRGRHHEAFLQGGARPWLSRLNPVGNGPREVAQRSFGSI